MSHFKKQGFTLLEVLVALAVLAIGLAAVIKVSMENAENTRYLRDKSIAHWVAMNVLTKIQVREEWSTGKGVAIMAEREWYWLLKVSETVDDELRRLEVQVYYHSKDEEPIAILVGFVGAPKSYSR
ncbi:MAG: type II secretion system protein GspI [Gammaproteobacteria bacterium]|nr:MAG: type II secretion system protein GspI [Gammaproteobacteria bacterium]